MPTDLREWMMPKIMGVLEKLRAQLDTIDGEIIDLLAQRFELCGQIAEYKLKTGIPVMQPERVEGVQKRVTSNGHRKGLRGIFVSALYGLIIEEACRLENQIIAHREKEDNAEGGAQGR